MRVIGGKAKRRIIKGTCRRTTRAVTGRIKESVFGILGNIEGKRVLDLFAGTGSFGIESLSRGAKEAVFIDSDKECVKLIEKNLTSLGLTGAVYSITMKRGLKKLGERDRKFDLIFVDPPFSENLCNETIKEVDMFDILGTKGQIIARYHRKTEVPEKVGRLILNRKEKYGESICSFYSRSGFPPSRE